MKIPYAVFKRRNHSPNWSGWSWKYLHVTLKARDWGPPCGECGQLEARVHVSWVTGPIRRPR